MEHLDAVVHNAGVLLEEPERTETGTAARPISASTTSGTSRLTHWLMPLLKAAPDARIVTVGSFAAKSEHLDLDDLQTRTDYRAKRTYARSKLAQMYCRARVDRRLRAAGSTVSSMVVHPGGALNALTPSRPPVPRKAGRGGTARGARRPPASGQARRGPAGGPGGARSADRRG